MNLFIIVEQASAQVYIMPKDHAHLLKKKPNPFSNTISNILGNFLGANPNTNPNIGKKKST